MDPNQLPDYIRNRQGTAPSLAHKAIANVGAGAGPYLSIMGDRFTFVDIAGNQRPVDTLYVDVVIVDVNDHMSKMYYASKYDPNNPTPPSCFSDNGVAPSIAAPDPQSHTCTACQWNKWGSKISEMGSKVKACRDEQKVAIIVPGLANNMFRLTIPPNSLTNWRAYVSKFLNAAFGMHEILTRLSFAGGGERGTLEFAPAPQPWLDAATRAISEPLTLIPEGKPRPSDIIVGRLDRPRQAAITPPPVGNFNTPAGDMSQPIQEYITPLPLPTFPSNPPGFQPTPMAPPSAQAAPPAPVASPSEAAPTRRRRRTRAEMEAAQSGTPAAPAQAPFPTAANSGGNFGIQAGTTPNAEIQAALDSIF